ncbi:Vacuolar protein sorting-associated protein 62 [Exophiala dermatitidis]|uniref:Vacuolar protein sorting-associated protein 62 n=1 Tax=Exophiala dermatitidis (strain ATCC 34100 / CBS 525.76 / NIH/UT8656) TaxID=858893 RepID=H6BWY2_EXODN|nr:uncharacterized protein HMPREF1120_04235 [Exophiala dermatitidis NIH/UT8656]EHY56138.1 hypothetical protein HMPREF1120_04235 [Exophiala dermatitidis NIH/UT8656]
MSVCRFAATCLHGIGIRLLLLVLLVDLSVLVSVSGYKVPDYVIEYAPIIYLRSDDPFMPSDIAGHIVHTRPFLGFEPIPETEIGPLDLNNLSSLNRYGNGDGKGKGKGKGERVYLTSIDNVTSNPLAEWLLGETPDATTGELYNSTACAVVVVESTESKEHQLDAFYFYFYSFNEGADITQVLPPLNRIFPDASPGNHFGDHVGDWEHNMIRFKNGRPTGIYFSQHASGQVCDWDDDGCFSKKGQRPFVFSARGSHANYPSEGSHVHDEALVDIADKGRLWDPVKPAWFYKYDPDTDTFVSADMGTDSGSGDGGDGATYPTDWFYFQGAWGDKKYNDSDPRQKTVPYFGLKKYEDGPTGPKFKHLVRKGLMPDEKPKTNLMKVMVRWYLRLYGCCLHGINPWVVVLGTLLVLAAGAFVVVFAVIRIRRLVKRRWRQRKDRLGGERGVGMISDMNIPLLDLERVDDELES